MSDRVTYHVARDDDSGQWIVERWEGRKTTAEWWFDSHVDAERFAESRTDGEYV